MEIVPSSARREKDKSVTSDQVSAAYKRTIPDGGLLLSGSEKRLHGTRKQTQSHVMQTEKVGTVSFTAGQRGEDGKVEERQ